MTAQERVSEAEVRCQVGQALDNRGAELVVEPGSPHPGRRFTVGVEPVKVTPTALWRGTQG
jgi:hypothetical protein